MVRFGWAASSNGSGKRNSMAKCMGRREAELEEGRATTGNNRGVDGDRWWWTSMARPLRWFQELIRHRGGGEMEEAVSGGEGEATRKLGGWGTGRCGGGRRIRRRCRGTWPAEGDDEVRGPGGPKGRASRAHLMGQWGKLNGKRLKARLGCQGYWAESRVGYTEKWKRFCKFFSAYLNLNSNQMHFQTNFELDSK
jgi:hypothetical protein